MNGSVVFAIYSVSSDNINTTHKHGVELNYCLNEVKCVSLRLGVNALILYDKLCTHIVILRRMEHVAAFRLS